jgi:hypothetical protein
MSLRYVFRAGFEIGVTVIPTIWEWLGKLVESREHIKYDWLDGLVDDFAQPIAELTGAKDDTVEHLTHLLELNDSEAFDHQVDDSGYNDQSETNRWKT